MTMTIPNRVVSAGSVQFGNHLPLSIMAGPCQMESRDHALEMAAALKEISDNLNIGIVYKSSFDKANRTSLKSARGIGLDKALPIFAEIKEKYGLPIVTDIHEPEQCAGVAEVVDILQIPAFLCRQTDLLIAAARPARSSMSRKAVPGTVGHEECRRQDRGERQSQCHADRARRFLWL